MNLRKAILIALCAGASMTGLAVPLSASATTRVYLNSPPPPPRVEVVPAPRAGYVWVPGYWDAKHDKHVWKKGHWEKERVGYVYAPSTWVQREERWELVPGSWRRGDEDHDGIRNDEDRDRDGDGISNRRDNSPDNPNRR